MSDAEFLRWVADRLVFQCGESANVDFVQKLQRMADVQDTQWSELRRLRDVARRTQYAEDASNLELAINCAVGDAGPDGGKAMTLGQRIRAARESRCLSLRELARRIGVSAPYLSDMELDRRFPTQVMVEAINKALKTGLIRPTRCCPKCGGKGTI